LSPKWNQTGHSKMTWYSSHTHRKKHRCRPVSISLSIYEKATAPRPETQEHPKSTRRKGQAMWWDASVGPCRSLKPASICASLGLSGRTASRVDIIRRGNEKVGQPLSQQMADKGGVNKLHAIRDKGEIAPQCHVKLQQSRWPNC